MLGKIAEKDEYIQDCSLCHLAVKVGFFGVLLSIVTRAAWEIVLFTLSESSTPLYISMPQASRLFSPINLVGSLLVSIGFVGVFSMKGSKIGIVFPILVIFSRYNSIIFLQLTAFFGISSYELSSVYLVLVNAIFAMTSCLALLTIRRVSANPDFLTFYAFYYILLPVLTYALPFIFPGSVSLINGVSQLYISSLVLYFVSKILVIVFFALEDKMGCIDPFENQTDSVVLGKARKNDV